MSFIERIKEHLVNDQILTLLWRDMYNITIEDIAYSFVFRKLVYLDVTFFESIVVKEINNLYIYVPLDKDDILVNKLDHIMLLFLLHVEDVFLDPYPDYKIRFAGTKTRYYIKKEFLAEAWRFAVENGLETTKFGKTIESFGYIPPKTELYYAFKNNLKPVQVKSARKIDN